MDHTEHAEHAESMDRSLFSRPLDLKAIQITDTFWHREQELVRREVIPYQWEALNDRVEGAAPSWCMHNFRAAGRLVQEKRTRAGAFQAPSYTFRGFETLPEDPAHPDPDAFYGFVFQDTDFSKWIEAVAYTLTQHPDPRLEALADHAINVVCAAQWDNGYLDTYYILNGMDRAFTNLKDHHELYCLGHLVEGAVAYAEATGKRKLLDAACRFADYAASCFGPGEGQRKGYPGHEIAEMALLRLYEATGCTRYLDLARFFLDQRGQEPHYFALEERERYCHENGLPAEEAIDASGTPRAGSRIPARLWERKAADYEYYQAHLPVREQGEAVGHAVRAGYLYSGMADAARLTEDAELYEACEKLWQSITREKLYITGGVGGTHIGEAYSYPYDLPNDTAYSETCAAISLVFFARRMLQIHPRREYADTMELALYNTVLAGMSLDGRSFFYVNPLEVDPEACRRDPRKSHVQPVRQKWFGCACCPPNLARTVASVGSYAYTENADTLWFHLYMGSRITKAVGNGQLVLQVNTDMPWGGYVQIDVESAPETPCTLAFRLPAWSPAGAIHATCGGALLRSEWGRKRHSSKPESPGQSIPTHWVEGGYFCLSGLWKAGDSLDISFEMPVHMQTAHTRVREDIGKVAFTRGPITYCAEEADNGKDLHLCRVALDKLAGRLQKAVQLEAAQDMGHPMVLLKVPAKRRLPSSPSGDSLYQDWQPPQEEDITLILRPYYAWANRGEGEMMVWLRT